METVVRPVTVTALVEVKTAWCSATRCPSAEEIGRDSMMVKKLMTRKNALIAVREGDARTEDGDQILNARSFERQGYSVVLEEEELNHDVLLKAITDLYQNRETYIQTMKNSPQQNSIDTIIDLIESVARH